MDKVLKGVRVVERFVTPARPEVVWKVLSDLEHWCDWTPTVTAIAPLANGELSVGARYRVTQPKMRPAIYEVTECIPNTAFKWVRRVVGGCMVADHRIFAFEGETNVELSFASTGLLANVIALLFSSIIEDYVATEAKSLKARCSTLAVLRDS